MSSLSSVWMAAEWPRPLNSSIATAMFRPSSRELALSTASTGESFSRVRGSCGPTPSGVSASSTDVSSGTEKPAL